MDWNLINISLTVFYILISEFPHEFFLLAQSQIWLKGSWTTRAGKSISIVNFTIWWSFCVYQWVSKWTILSMWVLVLLSQHSSCDGIIALVHQIQVLCCDGIIAYQNWHKIAQWTILMPSLDHYRASQTRVLGSHTWWICQGYPSILQLATTHECL